MAGRAETLRSTSGPFSDAELVQVRSGVTPHGLPMLSWTLSSLGSTARDDGLDFARPPPVLQPTRFPVKGCAPACTPECCSSAALQQQRGRGLLSLESAFPF